MLFGQFTQRILDMFNPLAGDVVELHRRDHPGDIPGKLIPARGKGLQRLRRMAVFFPYGGKIGHRVAQDVAGLLVLMALKMPEFLQGPTDQGREHSGLVQEKVRLGFDVFGQLLHVICKGFEPGLFPAAAGAFDFDEVAQHMEVPYGLLEALKLVPDPGQSLQDRNQRVPSPAGFAVQPADAVEDPLQPFHCLRHFGADHLFRDGGGEIRHLLGPGEEIAKPFTDGQEISL